MRRAHVNTQPRPRCASLAYFQAIPLDRVQEPDLAQAENHKHADPKSGSCKPCSSSASAIIFSKARPRLHIRLGICQVQDHRALWAPTSESWNEGPCSGIQQWKGRPGEQAGSSNRIFWHLALHMPASCGDRLKNSLSNMDICSSESIPKCWMYPWHWRCLDGFLRSLGFTNK